MRRITACLAALLLVANAVVAQQPAPDDPNRWEPDIQRFEAEDRAHPPARGGIVFIGASSIVRWNLAESFPDLKAVNRGFGGSTMADSARYAGRVVVPHAPRIVVLYPGENDLARGAAPDAIGAGFATFYQVVHGALPNSRIVAIGLKPTPARWHLTDKMHATNRLMRSHCESHPGCVYVDVWPDMLGADGKPKPAHFVSDGQHMTPEGYKVWTRLVRPHLN